jgi:hypothetical protein
MYGLITMTVAALVAAPSAARIVERVDPISDERSVYAVVGDSTANLALGCASVGDPSTVRVVAHFPRYIGEATPGLVLGGQELQYRFDKRPSETVYWYANGQTVRAEAQRTRPVAFMMQMKGTTSVHLRALNYALDPVDMAFSYPDPTALIEDVLVRCGFDLLGNKPKRKR